MTPAERKLLILVARAARHVLFWSDRYNALIYLIDQAIKEVEDPDKNF